MALRLRDVVEIMTEKSGEKETPQSKIFYSFSRFIK